MSPKLNFPSNEILEQTIQTLKKVELSKVSFEKIVIFLRKGIVMIPVTIAKIHEGYSIFRGRINKNGERFFSEKDISYRTDFQNISDFGRANIPHQSMFYGAYELEKTDILTTLDRFRKTMHFRLPKTTLS